MTLEQTHECPICENETDSLKLESKGLSFDDLLEIKQYVKEGILGEILRLGNSTRERLKNSDNSINFEGGLKYLEKVMRDLGPEIEGKINELNSKWETSKTDNKSSMLEAVNTLWSALNQLNSTVSRVVTEVTKSREGLDTLSKKLGGTIIGNTTERIILQELKRACPLDSFSNDLSLKRRTDIIGTVFDKQRKSGKISISVKNTEKWENDFMNQLLRNMKDDGTHIGILATKSFPAEALSEQMYVPTDTLERKVIIVVKLEFISLAYFALRHLIIHMFEKEQEQKRIDKDIDIATETVKALLKFINGEEYKEFIQCTANAINSAKTTIEGLDKLKTYVETSVKNSKTLQESIAKNLEHAKDIISKSLDEILHDSPS